MSQARRRRGDPHHADHREDRAPDPVLAATVARLSDDVGELSAEVRGLATQISELSRMVDPVLEKHAEETRRAEVEARVEERLREMGLVVPPRIGVDDAPPATAPATHAGPPPESPTLRDGWARDLVLAAETTGGRRLIGAMLSAWALAWVGAAGVDLAHDIWARVMAPDVVAPLTLPDIDDRESPVDTGPQLDTPTAPRPTL